MNTLEALEWRYACKRMTGEKIPKEKLDNILESIRLAPSSFGLQPYSIIVIENIELLNKIQPIAYMQAQVVEASVLLVFAAWDSLTQEKINDYISLVAKERNISEDNLKHVKESIESQLKNTNEESFAWNARQAYIALGVGLVAAAMQKIDSCPMEGFNNTDLDEILQLKERGLKSVALLALGYRNEELDMLAKAKKVRREKDKLFISLQSSIGFNVSNIYSII